MAERRAEASRHSDHVSVAEHACAGTAGFEELPHLPNAVGNQTSAENQSTPRVHTKR